MNWFAFLLSVTALVCHATAQDTTYSLSRAYNQWDQIANDGELAGCLVNASSGSRPSPFSDVLFKYGTMFNSFARERIDVTADIPAAVWTYGSSLQACSGRKLMINVGKTTPSDHDGSRSWGVLLYDGIERTMTRLDPAFAATSLYDRSDSGWSVGCRHRYGLGHKAVRLQGGEWVETDYYTSVAVVVSPGGAVAEVPHPTLEPYGLAYTVDEFNRIHIDHDNVATLTGVNEAGLACGFGWRFDRDTFGGHENEDISFTYDTATGATFLIPGLNGAETIKGAADINDLGEVVGVFRSQSKYTYWLHLPEARYGLGSGTHVIFETTDSGSRGILPLDHDVKINNLGQVIFPETVSSGSTHSRRIWDAGNLRTLADINPDPSVSLTSIRDFNDLGQILVNTSTFQSRILYPSPVRLTLTPDRPIRHLEETHMLKVEVTHLLPDSATYEFDLGPFDFDPEYFSYPGSEDLEEGELPPDPLFPPVEPFTLRPGDEPWIVEMPVIPLKRGSTLITTRCIVTREDGSTQTIALELPVLIDPLEVRTTVTVEPWSLNQVPESQWGPRAQEVAQDRRQDIIDGTAPVYFTGTSDTEPEPFRNLLELEMTLTNRTDRTIDRLSVPSVAEIQQLIKSTEIEKPGVPLFALRFYSHNGAVDDLTVTGDEFVIPDITLAKDESATFAWVFEAYDANPDPEVDNSANLVFEPLILGRVVGGGDIPDIDLRQLESTPFNILDKPLLRWGIKPRGGRNIYLSGQPVWVDGYLENISAENGGVPRELLVMMYPLPEGNLGGGFPKNTEDQDFPPYHKIFRIPAEGVGKRIDVESYFVSLPGEGNSTGTAGYGLRVWIVEDDDSVTKADSQTILDEDWTDHFEVGLKANRPLLSESEERKRDCLQAGLSPLFAGIEDGRLEFVEGIYGLYDMALKLDDLNSKAWKGFIVFDLWAMYQLWEYSQGDSAALTELYRGSYEKYLELYNLGLLGAKTVPLGFQAFINQAGDAMSGFFGAVRDGDLTEVQFRVGKFLGANADLALEPLMMGMTYARLARAARRAESDIVTDAIAIARREAIARERATVSQRIAAGKANPAVSDLSSVLRAGDRLSRKNLLEIFGVDAEQLRRIQKIARENDVLISFRSRSKKARDLLAANLAWPKPQALKFKTVSEIDIKYLGYAAETESVLDIVAPPSSLINKSGDELKTAIDAYMDVLKGKFPELKGNDVLLGEVRSRLRTRVGEWHDYAPKLNLNPNGEAVVEISTAFEANLQFALLKERDLIPDIAAGQSRYVRTTLTDAAVDPVTGEARKRWTLQMGEADGTLYRPVTGDVDVMAILEPNGGMILDADRRLKVYTQLAEAVDMQHGESFTFFIDKARQKFLDGNTYGKPGAEALCCISPRGDQTPTAGFFVKSLSIIKDNNSKYLPVREAIKTPDKLILSEGRVVLEKGKSIVSRRGDVTGEYVVIAGSEINSMIDLDFINRFQPYILEETLKVLKARLPFHVPGYIARNFGLAQGNETYARPTPPPPSPLRGPVPKNGPSGPGLLQLRTDPATGLLAPALWKDGAGWRLLTTTEMADLTSSGTLQMLPMTYLTAAAPRKGTTLPVASQAALEVSGSFFEPGDRVVIDPGGEHEEFGTLVSVDPFVLGTGLMFDQEAGTMIGCLGRDTTDRDRDGLDGYTEIALGTGPDAPDSDADGVPDGDEIDQGSDPLVAQPLSVATGFPATPSDPFSFRLPSIPGYRYSVEGSLDLSPGSWSVISSAEGTGDLLTLDTGNAFTGAPRAFFRMRLEVLDDADDDGLSLRDEAGLGTDPDRFDSDGDGIGDGEEMRIGTDPLDSESRLTILSSGLEGGTDRYLLRFTSVNGIAYQVESSDSLAPGSWALETGFTATAAVSTISLPVSPGAVSRRFFRVRAIPRE